MHFVALATTAVVILLAFGSPAHAALVRYDFTAEASSIFGVGNGANWPSLLEGGDSNRKLTGHFVVDTSLGSTEAYDSWAYGANSVLGFALRTPRLNGRTFVATASGEPPLNYSFSADFPGGPDELSLSAALTGPEHSRFSRLFLSDLQGTALNGLYPTGALSIELFEQRVLQIGVVSQDHADWRVVHATLTSVTATPVAVPEASALLLLGPTLAAWLASRRYPVSSRTPPRR
jgi:hypothetical protein